MRQDRLAINFDIPSEPLTLAAYIEDCRMKLWDNAFLTFFRGQEAFNKTLDFLEFKGTDLLVRRVLFRCVGLSLLQLFYDVRYVCNKCRLLYNFNMVILL